MKEVDLSMSQSAEEVKKEVTTLTHTEGNGSGTNV
jgi:hypothetical protein